MTSKDDYKDFELLKQEYMNIQHMIDTKNNPISKGGIDLIKKIPVIGEMIDSGIDVRLEYFQNKKREELINRIIEDVSITKDKVLDIDFIIDFAKVSEAVDRLASREKIQYFANLLKNKYFVENIKLDNNTFDEYLYALNNLSYRQIRYLCILSECTKKIKNNYPNKINDFNIGNIYNQIEQDFINELSKIGVENTNLAISILKSTTFVKEFKGVFNSSNFVMNSKECIYLEESFEDFSDIVNRKFNNKEY